MLSSEISLGHAASHSPMFEQLPNPSESIWSTIARTRRPRSGAPWGISASWVTLAPVKSDAEALGQAATQAPQPMHAAESKARSERSLPIFTALASGLGPVFTET